MHNRALNSHEPIHGSTFLLALKLFMVLALTDLVYLVTDRMIFIAQESLYSSLMAGLTMFYVLKSLIQIILILLIVFHWLDHKYHIDYAGKKMYEYKGLIHTQEQMYDLKYVRDVNMEQNMWGKLFNYGNIVITLSASGGYAQKVVIKRIQDPRLYIDYLENCGV